MLFDPQLAHVHKNRIANVFFSSSFLCKQIEIARDFRKESYSKRSHEFITLSSFSHDRSISQEGLNVDP